jgi:hypothetical protein
MSGLRSLQEFQLCTGAHASCLSRLCVAAAAAARQVAAAVTAVGYSLLVTITVMLAGTVCHRGVHVHFNLWMCHACVLMPHGALLHKY